MRDDSFFKETQRKVLEMEGESIEFPILYYDFRTISGTFTAKTNKIKKQYIKKIEMFKTKGSIYYGVDAGELVRTKGEYVIMLSNLSKVSHAVGTIVITYPAESKARHKRD